MRPGQCETGAGVVKGRTGPVRRAVTGLTSRRESSLHVTRIIRAVVVRLVALNAGSRVRQVIGSARTEGRVMALRALQCDVRSVQSETGAGMIEGSSTPIRGGVALLARDWEIRLDVIRVRRAVEIRLVALHASRRCGQVIRPTRTERGVVTLCALQCCVRPGKCETRR